MKNRLDNFIPFLLDKIHLAHRRGLRKFRVTHATGDYLYVTLGPGDRVEVVRRPKVQVPGLPSVENEFCQMRLATTVRQLERDIVEGITSYNALEWRG